MCVLLVNYKDKCVLIINIDLCELYLHIMQTENLILAYKSQSQNQFKIYGSLWNRQVICMHPVFSCKFWSSLSKDCGYGRLQLCMKNFYCRHQSSLFSSQLHILLLFLQIIVLRAHFEGCQFISDSIKFYFLLLNQFTYNLQLSTIHLLPFWSTNRWNMTFYSLFLLFFWSSSVFTFYLPPFKSWQHLFMINRPQMQILTVWLLHTVNYFTGWTSEYCVYSIMWIWLSNNLTSLFFSMILCLNEPLTATSSN